MRGWHPSTLGWALLRLNVAKARLLWEAARALRINRLFGIPDRRALPLQPASHKEANHGPLP